jgi:hypothetical protein
MEVNEGRWARDGMMPDSWSFCTPVTRAPAWLLQFAAALPDSFGQSSQPRRPRVPPLSARFGSRDLTALVARHLITVSKLRCSYN